MNIGDSVYVIIDKKIAVIIDTISLYNYLLGYNDGTVNFFYTSEFLTMEQCADIVTNLEIQQLVLNYKK